MCLTTILGRLAQLVERYPYKVDVTGSKPVASTMYLHSFQHMSYAVSAYSHEQIMRKVLDEEGKAIKDDDGNFIFVPDEKWVFCGNS